MNVTAKKKIRTTTPPNVTERQVEAAEMSITHHSAWLSRVPNAKGKYELTKPRGNGLPILEIEKAAFKKIDGQFHNALLMAPGRAPGWFIVYHDDDNWCEYEVDVFKAETKHRIEFPGAPK